MINNFSFVTQKTARIFQIGTLDKNTDHIWIVLHGYGYHAKHFLKKFNILSHQNSVVFAPEALNRFYVDGLTGKVGASWMTREDRENEINDYINYLDEFYAYLKSNFSSENNVKFSVLGFSQGGTTMCRWLANNRSKADHIVLWAGDLPHDFNFPKDKVIFEQANNYFVYGKEDQFLNEQRITELEETLKKENLNFDVIPFEGKHEINEKVLTSLSEKINSFNK